MQTTSMVIQGDTTRKATYGLDAPTLLPIAAALSIINIVLAVTSRSIGPIIGAAAVLLCAGLGLHASVRGKFIAWREVLDGLRLTGVERILDLGCGRGAVLLSVAKRLTTGRALGVDIWRRSDQSGNSPAATRRNAAAEGVAGRVAIMTADMTSLPLRSGSFDLITSNVAIHNIRGRLARQRAVDEAVRVLAPGGRLALADLRGTRGHAARLEALGMLDVTCRSLGWRMWWGGPWVPTKLVTATKPARGPLDDHPARRGSPSRRARW
jgi:arsenite methyltransferase